MEDEMITLINTREHGIVENNIIVNDKKLVIFFCFISSMFLFLNILMGLAIYFLYISVNGSINELTGYIDNGVHKIENYLNNYTLHVKFN